MNDLLSVQGNLALALTDSQGRIIETWQSKNMVVNSGKNAIVSLLSGSTTKNVTHIAVGLNDTAPVPTDVSITSPYQKAISTATVDANKVLFGFTFLESEAVGMDITEFGLIAQDGTLVARITRNPISKDASMTLTGIWTIIIN